MTMRDVWRRARTGVPSLDARMIPHPAKPIHDQVLLFQVCFRLVSGNIAKERRHDWEA